jgi:excisionase family DNA binding protein
MEKLYTVPEAAEVLRVTRAAVYKWIREKRIEVVYVGSERRITQSAIEAFIKASTDRRVAGGDTIEDESLSPSHVAAFTHSMAGA